MFLVYIWCGCFYIIYFLLFIYLYIYDLFIIFGIKRAWVKTIRSENPYQHSALKTGRNFADPTPSIANLSRRFWTSAICFSSPCLVVCVFLNDYHCIGIFSIKCRKCALFIGREISPHFFNQSELAPATYLLSWLARRYTVVKRLRHRADKSTLQFSNEYHLEVLTYR